MRSALLALALTATGAARGSLAAQDPELLDILETNQVSAWRVLGPFPSADQNGLEIAFIDEAHPDFSRTQEIDGQTLTWHTPTAELIDGEVHDLQALGAGDHDTIYLARTITALTPHEPAVGLGMDDSAVLWVNGVEVFRREESHAASRDQYAVPVALRAGENTILLKVVNKRGAMAFSFRLTDVVDARLRWGGGREEDGWTQYEISTVPIPEELTMEVGGLVFDTDGSLLVCCRRGQIYRIHNPAERDPDQLRIRLFAEGLHEPLGMMLEPDGSLLVTQIPELTRLRDTDGDGRADRFETVVQPWGLSGNYHEYHFGPVRDGDGNLWGTLNIGFPSGDGPERLYRGSAYRLTPAGEFLITCYGLRSPNGLVVDADGEVFYTDNQGEWMDTCRLAHLRPGRYDGHDVALQWAEPMTDFGWETERTLPAVWYPYHLARSTSWPVLVPDDGSFGPYGGQILVGDQGNALIVRTTLQQVNGIYQGACYPFWQGFASGVNRLAFDPDGVLHVGLTERGWGSVGPRSDGIQRLTYRGPTPFDLLEVTATHDGFALEFTEPLAEDAAPDRVVARIREYGYEYWSTYGSGEIDARQVDVLDVAIRADRRHVEIRTGPRNTGKAFQLTLGRDARSATGALPIAREAFYTLLVVPD